MMIVFLVAACTMIPRYEQPELPVSGSWPEGPAYETKTQMADPAQGTETDPALTKEGDPGQAAEDGSSFGRSPVEIPADPFVEGSMDTGVAPTFIARDLSWQEYFTDPRLKAVIGLALENNRDLRVAALNIDKMRAMYKIQRSEIIPTITANGSGSRQRLPADLSSTGSAVIQEQYGVNVEIAAWELDFFGRIRSLSRKALEQYLATEHARKSAQILLVAETAQAYYTLGADLEMLALAQSTLESQQKSYELIEKRFDVGVIQKTALRQAQTQVDMARVDVARYTSLVAQDINALTLLAGTRVPEELLPENMAAILPMRDDLALETPSDVLLLRPDILQAESLLKAAYADIGAARASFFPRIALTTNYGTASRELSGLFESDSDTWLFSPGISLPIFSPSTWLNLRVSKVQREIALAEYEGAIQSAFRDVSDVLAQRGPLVDQVEAQRSLAEATADVWKMATERYEKGSDDYLNVLDAQRSYYSASQGLINVRLIQLSNEVQFYAVLGGGGDMPQETAGSERRRN